MSSSNKIHLSRDFPTGVYLSEARDPIPPLHAVYVCSIHVFIYKGKGWRGGGERRLEVQQFTKLGRKYQHD